jgi:hypothetical protein
MSIKYIKDALGLFIVEAAAGSIPTRLIALREKAMKLFTEIMKMPEGVSLHKNEF